MLVIPLCYFGDMAKSAPQQGKDQTPQNAAAGGSANGILTNGRNSWMSPIYRGAAGGSASRIPANKDHHPNSKEAPSGRFSHRQGHSTKGDNPPTTERSAPPQGRQGRTPTQRRQGGTPAQGRKGGTPAQGRKGGTPAQGRKGGTPAQGRKGGTPTQGRQSGTPTQGRKVTKPTQRRQGGAPTQGRQGAELPKAHQDNGLRRETQGTGPTQERLGTGSTQAHQGTGPTQECQNAEFLHEPQGKGLPRGVDAADLALAALERVSAEKMTSEELERLSTTLGRIRTRTSDLLRSVAEIAAKSGAKSAAGHLLGERAKLGNREIRRLQRAAKRLKEMPNTSERLRSGAITFEHAVALADAGAECGAETVDNDQRLLNLAEKVPIDQYTKNARSFAARHAPDRGKARLNWQRKRRQAWLSTEEGTGMGILRALFDPVSFNLLRQTIDLHTDELWRSDGGRDGQPDTLRTPQQRCSDAIFELLTGKPAPAHRPDPGNRPNSGNQPEPGDRAETGNRPNTKKRSEPGYRPNTKERANTENRPETGKRAYTENCTDTGNQPDTGNRARRPHAERPERRALADSWKADSEDQPPKDAPTADAPAIGSTATRKGRPPPQEDAPTADAPAIEAPMIDAPVNRDSLNGDNRGVGGAFGDAFKSFRAKNSAQLVVIAELGVLDGSKPDGRCEILGTGPVPPDILQELSPDTELTSMIFGGNGQPLWLGRKRRLANDHQRLAVAVRDGGCVLCDAPMHRCEIHHIEEWNKQGGQTDVENLAAICGHHHRWLHNNSRQLLRSPNGGSWSTRQRPPPTGEC